MKQIALAKTRARIKTVMSALLLLSMTLFSIFVMAADSDTNFYYEKSQSEKPLRDFNHMTTGFALTGQHSIEECGTCHVGGVFKGTPRNCAGCHSKGRRVVATVMPSQHIVTNDPCELCHNSTVTFLGARYNHGKAQPGSCSTCHNGQVATGKPSNHNNASLMSTATCDKCHRTFAWIPTAFNHAGVAQGTCTSCHNGTSAIGRPASHSSSPVKAQKSCDSCHRTSGWYPTFFDHIAIPAGTCATCHNGVSATGKTSSHTGTKGTLSCDTCHTTSAWLPAGYNHAGVAPGSCVTCHNGVSATGMTSSHTGSKASLSCDKCHTTTAWLPASFNHAGIAPGTCSSCHEAQRPTSHASKGYTGSCDRCHTTSSWTFNHAAQQGLHLCNNCHQHHHNTTPCDQCHSVNSWGR